MELEFKTAEISDINTIYELSKELIDTYENVAEIEYDKVLEWVKKKITKCISEYICVCLDNQVVAYYHFQQVEDKMELDDLYVLPNYQNQGIGSVILEKCCGETDMPIYLYVFTRNTRAISLYERFGFKVIEKVKDTRLIMQRDI